MLSQIIQNTLSFIPFFFCGSRIPKKDNKSRFRGNRELVRIVAQFNYCSAVLFFKLGKSFMTIYWKANVESRTCSKIVGRIVMLV